MIFENQHYQWLLWLLPALIIFYWMREKKRSQLFEKLIKSHLLNDLMTQKSKIRRNLKKIFIVLALLFLVISLLRPQWGFELREISRKGVDIFVLADTSQSMLAQDFKPSRLERLKRELTDLLGLLRGDRIGLIPFAGQAYVACPLTTDYSAFSLFIDQLDTELIPTQGTNIQDALKLALKSFDTGHSKSKTIVIMTDGEATVGEMDDIIDQVKQNEIKVFVVGMGTTEGAPIPESQASGFKNDKDGKLIISKINEVSLQNLALKTGGTYVRSVTSDQDLNEIYLKGIKRVIQAKELKKSEQRIPVERYQIPLLIALTLLLFEPLIAESKKG